MPLQKRPRLPRLPEAGVIKAMCVALPGKVISLEGNMALVDFGGSRVNAMTGLVEVDPGDRVLVHAGCIMEKLRSDEAEEMEELYKEIMGLF